MHQLRNIALAGVAAAVLSGCTAVGVATTVVGVGVGVGTEIAETGVRVGVGTTLYAADLVTPDRDPCDVEYAGEYPEEEPYDCEDAGHD